MFYYATRNDKEDNRLMTSYGNAASQKKYGGADAKLFNGAVVCNLESGKFTELDNPDTFNPDEEVLVRSRIHCPNPSGSSGKFVIYKKKNDEWVKTEFRSTSYGAANTLMKAIVGMYGDLIVVEETDSISGSSSNNAPF